MCSAVGTWEGDTKRGLERGKCKNEKDWEREEVFICLQIYEKVAAAFNLDKDVVIANVDADKYKDLAEKWVQWHILIYLLVKLGWYHI